MLFLLSLIFSSVIKAQDYPVFADSINMNYKALRLNAIYFHINKNCELLKDKKEYKKTIKVIYVKCSKKIKWVELHFPIPATLLQSTYGYIHIDDTEYYTVGEVDTFFITCQILNRLEWTTDTTVSKEVINHRDSIHIDTISPFKFTIHADTVYVNGKPIITRDTTVISKLVLKRDTFDIVTKTIVQDSYKVNHSYTDSTSITYPFLTLDFRKTDVENLKEPNIKIYPQPANNYLRVEGIEDYFSITDILGITYYEGKSNYIDISKYPNGIYYIMNTNIIKSFIINR